MPQFQWAFDRPFTVIHSAAAGQNMSGAVPTSAFVNVTNGARYPESATGTCGLFRFHPKWDLEIQRVAIDLPGTQTTYQCFLGEDGVETLWFQGGAGVTDVLVVTPMPLRADGYVRILTTGAPNGVITAKVTARRADPVRVIGA